MRPVTSLHRFSVGIHRFGDKPRVVRCHTMAQAAEVLVHEKAALANHVIGSTIVALEITSGKGTKAPRQIEIFEVWAYVASGKWKKGR